MPTHIEDAITKMIRDFIWNEETTPRLSLEHLYSPTEKGGMNILDIHARNKAIEITWLREYLNLTPS